MENEPNAAPRPEDNVGLVRALVPRFLGRGVEYDDLFQAGCEGLVKAARHFDPSRGFRFSTYAVPVILGEMRRLFREGGTVKVSRGLRELSVKAARLSEEIAAETGRAPSVAELAERLSCTPEKCAEALCAAVPPVSLSGEDGEADSDVPTESMEEHISDRLALRQVIRTLPEQDRRLIEYRYYANRTQQQTAEKLGLTQVQVSRREKKLYLRSLLL